MMESVHSRQRGAYDFESHYDNLCAMQDTVPLSSLKTSLSSGILDVDADGVRLQDWEPIIRTLAINKSLECVAVRSAVTPQHPEACVFKKVPAIRSKEITFRLCKALHACLCVSPTLMFIELSGLPLRERDVGALMKGIVKNGTLVHLSFEKCRVGDQCVDIICQALCGAKKVASVNLSNCSLTPCGAEHIAKLIKHQAVKRNADAWKESLRYGEPLMDKMAGIRRITLNGNPTLGDRGAGLLADALKDDRWIKALDMHNTGLSTLSAEAFLDVLKFNTTINVLDLRRNPLIDRSVLRAVMEHVLVNSKGQETEYKWIDPPRVDVLATRSAKTRQRITKVPNRSVRKKASIKVSSGYCCRRTQPGRRSSAGRRLQAADAQKPTPGLPWRTAARAAHRCRGTNPAAQSSARLPCEDGQNGVCSASDVSSGSEDGGVDNSERKVREAIPPSGTPRRHRHDVKRADLDDVRRTLREERVQRSKVEQKVVELMLENRRLEHQLRLTGRPVKPAENSLLEDGSFLDNMESTIKAFHGFLDMLREAGLGELITMAGLNQKIASRICRRSPAKVSGPVVEKGDNNFKVTGPVVEKGDNNFSHFRFQDSRRPGSTDAAPADHLYLKEKEEADEVYRRLLVGAQWSGKPALTTFQEQHACAPDTDDRTGETTRPGQLTDRPLSVGITVHRSPDKGLHRCPVAVDVTQTQVSATYTTP